MNTFASATARQLKDVYFGGNWTMVNVFSVVEDLQVSELNLHYEEHHSLLELIYHQYYFVTAVQMVLSGKELTTKDKYSFDAPRIEDEREWKEFLEQIRNTVLETVELVEKTPDDKLLQPFVKPEYGILFRNVIGVVEHIHYHLGQITLLKKQIRKHSG